MADKSKLIIKEFCLSSTAYGFPNLIRSKNFYQKILWIIFIIVATSTSAILIKEAVIGYFEFEVVTLIRSVYEQPTEFPTVTMCSVFKNFDDKSPKDLIKDCSFAYNSSCMTNPGDFFEAFYTSYFGKCFKFNSGKNLTNHSVPVLKSTISGVDDSLAIEMYTSQDLVVFIHNRSAPITLEYRNNHDSSRIFVSSNSFTEIPIRKLIDVKLGEPYNQCLEDVTQFKDNKTIIDYIIIKNQTYNQEKCLELCFDLDYIETNPCNCTNASLGTVWNKCWINLENSTINSCTWINKIKFYSQSISEKCSNYCPLECTSVTYDIRSTTIVNYYTTKVKIFYASLKYTSITQKPKVQLIDLISNIGGTFGLLIGFSFITFFEIIEIVTEIILNNFRSEKINVEQINRNA